MVAFEDICEHLSQDPPVPMGPQDFEPYYLSADTGSQINGVIYSKEKQLHSFIDGGLTFPGSPFVLVGGNI